MEITLPKSDIQPIDWPAYDGLTIHMKRDDLIHPKISGNKLFKLLRNIEFAEENKLDSIVTFGGAYSNHIAATASMCQKHGLNSIGIIRGEAPSNRNPTLAYAECCGMKLKFISREEYKSKNDPNYINSLKQQYPRSHIIPEGGANLLGIDGAMKMLDSRTSKYDYVVCAMGTGTTFAGLVKAAPSVQKIIGIPIHKHENLLSDIIKMDKTFELSPNATILNGFHLGGYAKWTPDLINFIQTFYLKTSIKLDPIYTGKVMLAIESLCKTSFFPKGSSVLFIHSGGVQGAVGFEERFRITLYK